MAKKKRQGYYCKVCGEIKANEKFSGKGHAKHICKSCQSSPTNKPIEIIDSPKIEEELDRDYDNMYDYADIDSLPIFSEKKKFKELERAEKNGIRDYIYSEIIEFQKDFDHFPNEEELIIIRKRLLNVLEEEWNIILKNDAVFKQFFNDNATATINRLKKMENRS